MEVTRYNFFSLLDELRNKISKCSFIAMDLELSGLRSCSGYTNSLFDSAGKRYEKYRMGMGGIVITQIGLSIFRHDRDNNSYISSTYTFHLSPQNIGDINQICTFEASVFSFLEMNDFDMNKFAYEGIPYLNKDEENVVCRFLDTNNIETNFLKEDVEKYWSIKSQVAEWLNESDEEILRLKETSVFQIYVKHKLKLAFPCLDITTEKNEIIIKRNNDKKETSLNIELKEEVLNFALGFSHVVKILENEKKPLIFHNAFGDIIMFYKQFIAPLPSNYEYFKCDFNKIFPTVYDSKYIFMKLKHMLNDDHVFENSSLKNVYTYFHEEKGRFVTLHSPIIKMDDEFSSKPWFHHAGWDAYCTGFCFIRMCHYLACRNISTARVLTSAEHIAATKPYCNVIYLSRAAQPFVRLNDYDPAVHRPPHLHVKLLKNDAILNITEIANTLGKFGSVDVKKYGKDTAIVAVAGYSGARKIIEEYKHSKILKISYFRTIKHSPLVRMALWSSFLLSTTGAITIIFYHLQK